MDYYWNQLIVDENYIIVVSNNLIYVWDFDLKYKICPVNSLGLITLHRNYVKDYIDFSSYDLNFANNFRFWFFNQSKKTGEDIFNKTSQLLCCFERGNFMTIRIQNSEEIKIDIKSFKHETQDTTIPSGIAIFSAYESLFIAQSSRYSDLLICKLEYERTLKRPKLTEEDEEFVDLYLLPNPRLIVVDRLHVHGALEDLIVRMDDQDEVAPISKMTNVEDAMVETKTSVKTNFDVNETTLIYTSGYLYQSYIHVLKTHLNFSEKGNIAITNVDKLYWIQIHSSDTFREINAVVVSSDNETTRVLSYINNEFKEITDEYDLIKDQFTLHWFSLNDEFILQITEQTLKLLSSDAKTTRSILQDFTSPEILKSVSTSKDKKTIYAIGSENHIFVFQINSKEGTLTENIAVKEMLSSNSDIIRKNYHIMAFTWINKGSPADEDSGWDVQKYYFIASTNSIFEIFSEKQKIFKCSENLKSIPSLLMDTEDCIIDGYRWFTDLTVPLVGIIHEKFNKNLDHSVKEIHYHTFNNQTAYIFAVLLSGQIQVFQQIEWLGKDKKIRFKKILVPGLMGKSINIDFQEYTYKESSLKKSQSWSNLEQSEQKELKEPKFQVKHIPKNQIKVLNNGMIYIKELNLIVHEMKGRLFAYRINKHNLPTNNYKCVESWGNTTNLIVSDSSSFIKVIEPQKEFNFGQKSQIYSDSPQFRFKNPEFGTFK